ncbi:MAG: MerR family transcriptional regulator [Pyrinomonadaceae bacterium]
MQPRSKQSVTGEPGALLKIGEVAKLSGIGIEALRFYERSGLLGRPSRNQSRYRMYDREVLERLDFIKRAQVLGFSLDEIKQITRI